MVSREAGCKAGEVGGAVGMARRALITGITGQDGSYLAELLLSKGYEVHGLIRRVAAEDQQQRLSRIAHIVDRLQLHQATLESYASVYAAVSSVQPDELYHLAAQSFVASSFEDAFSTFHTNIDGTLHVLESVRRSCRDCRVYFAGTSEMFGEPVEVPQKETTPFRPRSPYGVSKVAGFELTRNYREAYGMFACSGILFNHESPRRGFEFVTRKISAAVARIKAGVQEWLTLGNLDARRDWGHARDYVQAMWLMLQGERPADYVVATGESHSVKEFCELAFGRAGLDWQQFVVVNEENRRPADISQLVGNARLAARRLAWRPTCKFRELVAEMVDGDVAAASNASPATMPPQIP